MKTYQPKGSNTLLILNHKTLKKVLVANVVLLEGNINYTILYMQDGKTKLIPHTLKFFESFLRTHGFLRVHRFHV
ncbi:MAG: LytTR family transcriptional regulator DNA-binding domain-containing protein [Arcicella sp.]|nr:LytTR family transcriptional regulator DNA-binding domain-containing protein [Arcicella sp.]